MSNYFDDSGLIFFQCDNCGRRLNSVNYYNGMNFCAKCYQEIFGETDKDRKISDLEAKLAEKDKSKTEFAIKQLERVKEFVVENSYVKVYKNEYGGYNETEPYVDKEDMLKELDKMISEIKGE